MTLYPVALAALFFSLPSFAQDQAALCETHDGMAIGKITERFIENGVPSANFAGHFFQDVASGSGFDLKPTLDGEVVYGVKQDNCYPAKQGDTRSNSKAVCNGVAGSIKEIYVLANAYLGELSEFTSQDQKTHRLVRVKDCRFN
ncbi:hypothetical protein K2X30_01235 [bacterium]|nr:hypothetical protein [bacterium]